MPKRTTKFKSLPVSEMAEIISGGTPKTSTPKYWDGEIPWLSVADFNIGRRWVRLAEKCITEEGLENSPANLLKPNDIVLSARGTVGVLAQVRSPMAFNQSCFGLRGNPGIDTDYLYYALRTAVEQMHQIAHGGVFSTITRDSFKKISLPCPSLERQREIAAFLGAFDDKIDLNDHLCATLEAMARALFKSWFVDFEPVRAKAAGKKTGLPKEIEKLFPDRLVKTKLGQVPEGWKMVPLPELVEINPTRSLRRGQVAPYLDMANMPTQGHSAANVIPRAFGSGMRFRNGDTLLARITPCLENGKTAFVDFLQEGQVGWGSTEYIVLHPKAPLPVEFAYCLARSEEFRDFSIHSMTGSSGRQRVPAEAFDHFLLACAPEGIIEAFEEQVVPSLLRASTAAKESKTLSSQRDMLLPKLLFW